MSGPQYDEQFRRGYDGPPITPPPKTPVPRAPVERESASPVAAKEQVPTGMSQQLDELEAAMPSAQASPPIADDDPAPRRPNPFTLALVGLAVLMVVVGVWLVWKSSMAYSSGYTPEEQTAVLIEGQLAAPFLTGGVVAFLAWVVLGAVAASSRSRRD